MRCDTARELFSDYLEGSIDQPMALALEQHFAECADCKQEYALFEVSWAGLNNLPSVDVPLTFHRETMERIMAERASKQRRSVRAFSWANILEFKMPVRAFAAAFVLLLVIGIAVQMGQQTGAVKAPVIGAPQIQQSWPESSNDIAKGETGVELSVDTTTSGAYQLRVEQKKSGVSEIKLYLLPAGQSRFTNKVLETGNKMSIPSAKGKVFTATSGAATAYLEWQYKGQQFSEVVYLPNQSAGDNSGVKLFNGADKTLYSALATASNTYGVVIEADADMGSANINAVTQGSIEDALSTVLRDVDGRAIHWDKVGDKVYAVNRE